MNGQIAQANLKILKERLLSTDSGRECFSLLFFSLFSSFDHHCHHVGGFTLESWAVCELFLSLCSFHSVPIQERVTWELKTTFLRFLLSQVLGPEEDSPSENMAALASFPFLQRLLASISVEMVLSPYNFLHTPQHYEAMFRCPFSSFILGWQKQGWQISALISWALEHSYKYAPFTFLRDQRQLSQWQFLILLWPLRWPYSSYNFPVLSRIPCWDFISRISKETILSSDFKSDQFFHVKSSCLNSLELILIPNRCTVIPREQRERELISILNDFLGSYAIL